MKKWKNRLAHLFFEVWHRWGAFRDRVGFEIRLFWNRLWLRRDEFHPSLNGDYRAYTLSSARLEAYRADLVRRRAVAHERDLAETDRRFGKIV